MKYQLSDIETQIAGFKGKLTKLQAGKEPQTLRIHRKGREKIARLSGTPDLGAGHLPIYETPPFSTSWEVREVEEGGAYAGRVTWQLMDTNGSFPVTRYEDSPVTLNMAADWFATVEEAEAVAQECNAKLHQDIMEWFGE